MTEPQRSAPPPEDPGRQSPSGMQLMEYMYLLPAILALSPLWVAYSLAQDTVSRDTAIYLFRLITLAWLWMLTAVMLFHWRPSMRQQYSQVHNILKATCIACVALAPITMSSLALTAHVDPDVTIFSLLETRLAWTALIVCVLLNGLMIYLSLAHRATRAKNVMWSVCSVAVLISLGVTFASLI